GPAFQGAHIRRGPPAMRRLALDRRKVHWLLLRRPNDYIAANPKRRSMGLLVEGEWRDGSFDAKRMQDGRFVRPQARVRNWITPDGSPGPSGTGGFAAEGGRYHLYVSLACPWAHRTLIVRTLKRLENLISTSVVSWHLGDDGWTYDRATGSSGDAVNMVDK